jgi:hypothetical protein
MFSKKSNKKKSNKKKSNNKTKYDIISLDKLRQMLKKYKVLFRGSKENMAQGLFRLRGAIIKKGDLELIYKLLDKGFYS